MGPWASRARIFVAAVVITGLLALPAPVRADDGPTPIVGEPSGGVPVEPPLPVDGAPPGDAAAPASADGLVPDPVRPAIPPTPTFSVRVHGGVWTTWVPNVPLPVDYNGDLAIDGTLKVTVTDAPPTACLVVDFKLPLSGGRATSIEFQRGLMQLRLDFGDLPPLVTACSVGTASAPHVTIEGGSSGGSISAQVTDGGRTMAASIDRTPSSFSLEIDASQTGLVLVHHHASTSLRLDFTLSSPVVHGVVDRLPNIFDGEISFDPDAVPALAHLKYLASTGIGYVQITWGASWQADYFTTTLQNLPYWLELIPTIDRSDGEIVAVHLRQYSGAAFGPIYFLLRSDDVPYAMSAAAMPATIWGANIVPGKITGGQGSLRFQSDASGPIEDLRVEFGIETPNAFGPSQHYLLANVAHMPSWVDATYRTDGSSSMTFSLGVSATEPLPSVLFHLQLDFGDLDLTVSLYDVPSWLDASISMSGTTYVPGAPALSYRANAATFDFSVDSQGFDFGSGRLMMSGTNLPPTLDAWITNPGSSYLGQLDLSTAGTGRLGELWIDADLPNTLTGQLAHHFRLDFQDLARLSIAFLKPTSCTLRACAEFGYLDTGTFWWWNAPPVMYSITLFINYKVQQYETCWYGGCWVDKYSFGTSWPNGFAYYAHQYGLDGRPARAVGVPF